MLARKTNYMLSIGAEFTLDLNGFPDDRVHPRYICTQRKMYFLTFQMRNEFFYVHDFMNTQFTESFDGTLRHYHHWLRNMFVL